MHKLKQDVPPKPAPKPTVCDEYFAGFLQDTL